ncbi:MAG TPA: DUF3224 domain-containing protein [Gemmatimonadales bacterium]|nr:DUF3224 domain-containing protein [Gemmatimonadales bacterium]
MTSRSRTVGPPVFLAGLMLSLCLFAQAVGQTPNAAPGPTHKKAVLTMHARGAFDVKLTPQAPDGGAQDSALGRMTIHKQFRGDLEGTSRGQMLTAMTQVQGSAGYVAIEQVTGKLQGRNGTFALQHTGRMHRGAPQLMITVVPDSGTGELAGLAGQMTITIADGKHSYDLEYTLPSGR